MPDLTITFLVTQRVWREFEWAPPAHAIVKVTVSGPDHHNALNIARERAALLVLRSFRSTATSRFTYQQLDPCRTVELRASFTASECDNWIPEIDPDI